MVGSPAKLAGILAEYERSGEWIAEPKLDGQWVHAKGVGPGAPPRLYSRSGRLLQRPELSWLGGGVRFVGELVGKRMYVFDVLQSGEDISDLPQATRWLLLDTVMHRARMQHAVSHSYIRVPRWRSAFLEHFTAQSEGLVLKRKDGGPYIGGKVESWVKVKKTARYDVRVLSVSGNSATIAHLDGQPAGSVNARGWAVRAGQVLEIEAFSQYPSGRFRSARVARIRND